MPYPLLGRSPSRCSLECAFRVPVVCIELTSALSGTIAGSLSAGDKPMVVAENVEVGVGLVEVLSNFGGARRIAANIAKLPELLANRSGMSALGRSGHRADIANRSLMTRSGQSHRAEAVQGRTFSRFPICSYSHGRYWPPFRMPWSFLERFPEMCFPGERETRNGQRRRLPETGGLCPSVG